MYQDTINVMIQTALRKKRLLEESRFRYLLHAALAGVYVGIGIILIITIGAPLFAAHSPVYMMAMGASFGIALTLVIIAGSDLFTGNNMYFTLGTLSGATTWKDTLRNWIYCWGGNLLGALTLAMLVFGAGLFRGIGPDHLLFSIAHKKMSLPYTEIFFRGILCNWLVCMAIWCSARVKSESAKLILIWWMLYAFIASGYEHSVANMTVLSLALILPHPDTITWAGWFHNMIPATLGNIVGGSLFVACAYWIISPVSKRRNNLTEEEQRHCE